ncbi:retrovirus-related Pol polyprotein from transposon 297 [Trichonephila clavipes]|nr:retrovirus-related Pol polyprotein from transposon 297 [Trichonephila clavipes]
MFTSAYASHTSPSSSQKRRQSVSLIDFRKLNCALVKDHYPLPLIEDILDGLQDTRIFSNVDLRNGFFHVHVNKPSRPYTSFVTQNDDIVILAKNESEAIDRLKKVLKLSSDYGLEINFDKCQFLHRKIEFLGHIIENNKLFPSPSKTKTVVHYSEPKTTKEVQVFLGLTGYFRKFIPAYSMSKDDPMKWFKHVSSLQEVLNSTFQRSINTTPFELLFGTQINNKTGLHIQQLSNEQLQLEFNKNRELKRKAAKAQIIKVQNENKKSYNLRRKSPILYSVKDLVAIKRTQQGPGQKLCNKFIGPYKITKVKPNDTYNVEKCGNFDGPMKTSICAAEYLKPWPNK